MLLMELISWAITSLVALLLMTSSAPTSNASLYFLSEASGFYSLTLPFLSNAVKSLDFISVISPSNKQDPNLTHLNLGGRKNLQVLNGWLLGINKKLCF